jgi:hypothetical protein
MAQQEWRINACSMRVVDHVHEETSKKTSFLDETPEKWSFHFPIKAQIVEEVSDCGETFWMVVDALTTLTQIFFSFSLSDFRSSQTMSIRLISSLSKIKRRC